MLTDRFLLLLGMSVKAGKLKRGFDAVVGSIKDGHARAVFIAADISENTAENVVFQAERKNIDVRRITYTIEEISRAIGKNAGIVSICDINLGSKAIILSGQREEN